MVNECENLNRKEGHKLLLKFGAVFSLYNNCLQVTRAKSDFKTKP